MLQITLFWVQVFADDDAATEHDPVQSVQRSAGIVLHRHPLRILFSTLLSLKKEG